MKRCPECRRDYFDDSLLFCLDDGANLLDGPVSDEAKTATLSGLPSEAPTKHQINSTDQTAILPIGLTYKEKKDKGISRKKVWLSAAIIVTLASVSFFGFRYFAPNNKQSELIVSDAPPYAPKLYWQMSESEQLAFILERAQYVQTLIGDEPADFDEEAVRAIKVEIDDYVEEKDSLSQQPFEEGLRVIYGRASQYAPLVIRSYKARQVPFVLGLYQAMVESEYRDCPTHPHPNGPVGLFQFSRKTAAAYGLAPEDYCNIEKQADAAAHHMSDLISDFGEEKSNWTLALLSFNQGGDKVRDYLRQLRGQQVTERHFWAVLRNKQYLQPPLNEDGLTYVPRFFAAAIIGETPLAFELPILPLSKLNENLN